MDNCIFCNLIQGKMSSYTVYSDDLFTGFLDINPANPGHIVLVPKAHFSYITEMDEATYAKFFLVARYLTRTLVDFGAEGVNLLCPMGEVAGQRIPHAMIHIIPRYKNDNVVLSWNPPKLTEAKFEEIRQRIVNLIQANRIAQAPQPQKPQHPEPEQRPESVYRLPPRTGRYW